MPTSGSSETGASTLSRSCGVTWSVLVAPSRETTTSTGLPSGSRMMVWLNSGISSANRTETGSLSDAGDDVAGLEAGLRRRRAFDGAADERPGGDGRRLQQRLHVEPDPAALHAAVLDDRERHVLREIGRDRAGQAEADLVDADDLAVQVDRAGRRSCRRRSPRRGRSSAPAIRRPRPRASCD